MIRKHWNISATTPNWQLHSCWRLFYDTSPYSVASWTDAPGDGGTPPRIDVRVTAQNHTGRGIPAAAVAMVGWAASGVIAKGITELGALAVVFWRMWIYAFIVLLFLKLRGTPLRKESLKFSWRGGISLGADIMLFFSALRLTTVANATVIGSCQPLIMLLKKLKMFFMMKMLNKQEMNRFQKLKEML